MKEKNLCLNCDCYDADMGCTMPSVDKNYACPYEYENYFNKGNDCDYCQNQYLCGKDGDATGCIRKDNGLECEFIVE